MAMAIFRQQVRQLEPFWRVESAGTWTVNGQPAAANAIKAVAELGLDLSTHRSRVVTLDLLTEFDIILTMEQGHQEALRVEFNSVADRVFMLSEITGKQYDIYDPIGKPLSVFRQTAAELNQILTEGIPTICKWVGVDKMPKE